MGIRKYEKDGKQFYEINVKIRDAFGNQLSKRKSGVSSEAKAKRIEVEFKVSLLQIKNSATFPKWEDWVETCLRRFNLEYRCSTVINYRGTLGKRVTPFLKGKTLDKIKGQDIHDVLYKELSGVSGYTRKKIHSSIRKIMQLAVDEGLISSNPATAIKVKVEESKRVCLNSTEIRILLDEAYFHKHSFYDVWSLALLTGMRSGELHALLWTDVDFENNFISVNKSWSSKNGLGPTKSAKNREIPISKELGKFLKELKLSSQGSHVLQRRKEWDYGDQAKVLRAFCEKIGITKVKFHDLRATFITQLLLNDVPLAKVMYIVGHARIQTTQMYLRMVAKEVQGATEALGISLPNFKYSSNKVVLLK